MLLYFLCESHEGSVIQLFKVKTEIINTGTNNVTHTERSLSNLQALL
jgi:hypothetical protein